MATIKIPVFRLRGLDKELAEILEEADSRCATTFALQLDDMRERLATAALNAIGKNEARIMRRHADRDASGHLKASEKTGGLQWSNPDAQERMTEETEELQRSTPPRLSPSSRNRS
jgi:LmbE family N-acetylglucosaminyl deacetylase